MKHGIRHCKRSEAIHLSLGTVSKKDGLLRRFAPRNDGVDGSKAAPLGIS